MVDFDDLAARRRLVAIFNTLTPEMIEAMRAECDKVPDIEKATEFLAEARAALAKVGPPSNPEMDKDGLYYPLLFLCESVAPVLDWLNTDDQPAGAPVSERGGANGS